MTDLLKILGIVVAVLVPVFAGFWVTERAQIAMEIASAKADLLFVANAETLASSKARGDLERRISNLENQQLVTVDALRQLTNHIEKLQGVAENLIVAVQHLSDQIPDMPRHRIVP